MYHVTNFKRVLLASLLSCLLITNSVATTVENEYSSKELSLFADKINNQSFTYEDLISSYQKIDPSKAQEIKSFFAEYPEAKNFIPTHSTIDNNQKSETITENQRDELIKMKDNWDLILLKYN